MKKLIALILSLMLLCSCEPVRLHDCYVIDKIYTPSSTSMVMVPSANGSIHPIFMTHPEEYILIIEGIDDEGKTVQKSIDVGRVTYEKIEIGDSWEIEYGKTKGDSP